MPKLTGDQTKYGQYTGTGSEFDIDTGFKPVVVQLFKAETGETGFKSPAQAGSSVVVHRNVEVSGTDVLVSEVVASGCITLGKNKVTIGASPYVNQTDKVYYYLIFGK